MSWRKHVLAVVDSQRFQNAIIAVIVINAVTLGCETSPALTDRYGGLLHAVDRIALAIFVAELAARLYAHGPGFFRDPWSCFDALIVGIALVPASGAASVLRALRILRALRLVSVIPSMRRIVTALLAAIPGMGAIIALLALILYITAVMATELFGEITPEHFGGLGTSLFTLFQVMTGEAWPDIAQDVMRENPMAWIFFVVYILISTFIVLNLFIAVVVSAMEHQEQPTHPPGRDEQLDNVLAELRALRTELQALTGKDRHAPAPGDPSANPTLSARDRFPV